MELLWQHYWMSLSITTGMIIIVWVVYLFTKNPGIVDIFWGLGLGLVAVVMMEYYQISSIPQTIVTLMVLCWSLRLSLFLLFTRSPRNHLDERYRNLIKKWGEKANIKFLFYFLFQAFLQSFVALGFLVLSFPSEALRPNNSMLWLGVIVYIIGIVGETRADYQLYLFKKHSEDVCQIGYWAYSRHPNYFFEFLIWIGISWVSLSTLISINIIVAVLSLIGPLTLINIFFILIIPNRELQSLKKRPETYRHYQKVVSFFVPWFRKSYADDSNNH